MMPAPGSFRRTFGTCAVKDCYRDAQVEWLHADGEDSSLWVPLCEVHLMSGPDDGLEYVIEVHGFIPAGL